MLIFVRSKMIFLTFFYQKKEQMTITHAIEKF